MPAKQPNVVRAATILIVVSAVLAILESVTTLRNIGSTETVDALNKALSMGWARSSHLSVTTLQETLRIAANVAAVLAAAAGVLGLFAGRGSRQARIGLAVLSLPVFFACLMAGGYAGLGVVVGIGMLWSRNARPWFAPAGSPSVPLPAVGAQEPVDGAPVPPAPAVPTARPSRVTAAGVVAIVLSSLAGVGGLLGGIGLAVLQGRPDLRQNAVDRLHAEHFSLSLADLDRYLTAMTIVSAGIGLLGLLGVLAGVLVLRGSRWGRIALIVLSAVCAVISLISITSIISLVWLVGSLSVIFGLGAPESAAWFKQR